MGRQPVLGLVRPERFGVQVVYTVRKADKVAAGLTHERDLPFHRIHGVSDIARRECRLVLAKYLRHLTFQLAIRQMLPYLTIIAMHHLAARLEPHIAVVLCQQRASLTGGHLFFNQLCAKVVSAAIYPAEVLSVIEDCPAVGGTGL